MEKLYINDTTYFVKNTKAVVASLFNKQSTASGTYKALKGRTLFYDLQGELFAALIDNKYNEQFFVNTSLINGKTFYQCSTGELQERKLGLYGYSYAEINAKARHIARLIKQQFNQ